MTSEEAMSFDPNSTDAMFAKVLSKLEEQAAMLAEIRENGRQTESEIANLKSWKDGVQGQMALVAVLISAAAGLATSLLVAHFSK
jgi:uncharacterized protein YfcZ (UPF0381/DUF406 family)